MKAPKKFKALLILGPTLPYVSESSWLELSFIYRQLTVLYRSLTHRVQSKSFKSPSKNKVFWYCDCSNNTESESEKFTGETPNKQSFIRGCDCGKIGPSSHKRGELRYAII